MKITVSADKCVKKVHNFWNHIHFHPTDAVEDDWGQRILNRVAKDHVAKTVRIYAMLEDIVTTTDDGKLQYDFTLNDIRLDYLLSKGFNILLSYNFIPPCIASDPTESSTHTKNKTRYKGKVIVTSPPKDYALWEEICREYTRHIVERYGLETVKNWYLQCFNEPDVGSFFFRKGTDAKLRAKEYHKLYSGFERGVLSVSQELKIGGPALACIMEFFDEFLKLIKQNNNRLDYICVHTYGTEPNLLKSNERPINVQNTIEKTRIIKGIIKANGFSHLPLVVDEWGASSGGYRNIEDVPQLFFRETEVFSAYYGRMISTYDDIDLGVECMMICLSGQHEMVTDFSGFRNFFTLNFFAKPIYNAFAVASRLEGEKLECSIPYITDEFAIFPTKAEDGRIAVMITRCTDDFKELPDENLEITVTGFEGTREARLWKIDTDTANAYSEYQKLGTPEKLTDEQIKLIRDKADCRPQSIGKVAAGQTLTLNAQNNSLLLLEILPD